MKSWIIKGVFMIDIFVPDIYAQSIYRIDYEKLMKKGI